MNQGTRSSRRRATVLLVLALMASMMAMGNPAGAASQTFSGTLAPYATATHNFAAQPGAITASTTCSGTGVFLIRLNGPSGSVLSENVGYCPGPIMTTANATVAGTHQVYVWELSGRSTTYSGTVTFVGPTTTTTTTASTTTTAPPTTTTTAPPTTSGPTMVAASSSSSASATTALTVSAPAGVRAGHYLVASVAVTNGTEVINAPAGWAKVADNAVSGSGAAHLVTFTKFANTTEPSSYQFTWASATGAAGGMIAFSGVDSTTPLDGTPRASTTANVTSPWASPSVTTTSASALLVTCWTTQGAFSQSPDPVEVERFDRSGQGPTNTYLACNTSGPLSAGTYSRQVTTSAAGVGVNGVNEIFAIRGATSTTTTAPTTTTTAAPTTTTTTAPVNTYTVPANIPTDCSRAVESDLMSFFATVPNDSTILFATNGCYGQDRQLEVNDRRGLTFDGRGSTFKALTQREDDVCRANWRIQAGSNITLKNMTVRGANNTGFDGPRPDYRGQCQHGFSFDSTQGGNLLDSKSYDTWGDPVAVGPDRRQGGDYCIVPPARSIMVDRFHGFNSGRTVSVTHGDGVTFQNSYFGDIYDNAFDIETDAACESSRNVKILNNRVGRYHFGVLAYSGGEPPERSGAFEFSGNVVEAEHTTCMPAISIRPAAETNDPEAYVGIRDGFKITGNDIKTLGDGIRIYKSSGVQITGNTFRKNYGSGCLNSSLPWYPGSYAVVMVDVHGATVGNNTRVEGPNGGFTAEWWADSRSTNIN